MGQLGRDPRDTPRDYTGQGRGCADCTQVYVTTIPERPSKPVPRRRETNRDAHGDFAAATVKRTLGKSLCFPPRRIIAGRREARRPRRPGKPPAISFPLWLATCDRRNARRARKLRKTSTRPMRASAYTSSPCFLFFLFRRFIALYRRSLIPQELLRTQT